MSYAVDVAVAVNPAGAPRSPSAWQYGKVKRPRRLFFQRPRRLVVIVRSRRGCGSKFCRYTERWLTGQFLRVVQTATQAMGVVTAASITSNGHAVFGLVLAVVVGLAVGLERCDPSAESVRRIAFQGSTGHVELVLAVVVGLAVGLDRWIPKTPPIRSIGFQRSTGHVSRPGSRS